jgi:hypothetical protein
MREREKELETERCPEHLGDVCLLIKHKKERKKQKKIHHSLWREHESMPKQPAGYFRNTWQADLPGGGINAILSRQVDPAGRLGRQSRKIAR